MFIAWRIKSLLKKANSLYEQRTKNNVDNNEIQLEISVHKKLIALYAKQTNIKKYPYAQTMIQEGYRVCSSLNDTDSQYQLSKILFEHALFWEKLQSSCYHANIHKKYLDELYHEAFSFMEAAEEQNHPLAIRQHGLALIHGWGVEVNKKEGFKYIVDSIEQENAWENATKIFADLGLNKPEFFNYLSSAQSKK